MLISFLSKVDKYVLRYMSVSASFYELVENAAGVHPCDVKDSLKRLFVDGLIDNNQYDAFMLSATDIPKEERQACSCSLPIPHQLDFDWRFSEKGKKRFLNFIDSFLALNSSHMRVAFLGSPTLFRHYCSFSPENTDIYLIDFNAAKHTKNLILPENAHVVNCDLNYNMDGSVIASEINADVIIIDPPWYPEYYKKFFEVCHVVGSSQCIVLGVFPPIFTRSNIEIEREELNQFIHVMGFGDIWYWAHAIEYCTPPFERNVLHANGIFNYSHFWRKGDFFITSRGQKSSCCIDSNKSMIRHGNWSEKCIGIVRFKLLQSNLSEDMQFSIELDRLYDNDIYPSVSRRFGERQRINVWTSGNRVFSCSNIPVLFLILENLYDTNITTTIETEYQVAIDENQKEQILRVQAVIQTIVEKELEEYGEWDV